MDLKIKFKTVDEYISSFPDNVREKLNILRSAIRQIAPEAEEVISYNMPALKYHGILVYYAAHKEHIGFYPGISTVNVLFREYLSGFEASKGTIKFPLNKDIPLNLVKIVVRHKMKENIEILNLKKKKLNKK